MTLNQLRSFLAVADNGSVRAAAEELVVTQAAVSASVAALQKSLGVALITPDGRGLRLTDAGTSYARYARRILGLLDEAARAAAAAADPERGELRIAAVTTAAEQIVPGILGDFRRRHPQTGVRLEAGNRDRVRGLLDRHQVDLVLGGRPEPAWDVVVHAVRAHELVVVAAPELAAVARSHGQSGSRAEAAAAVAGPPDLAAAGAGLGHPRQHRRAAGRPRHLPADADGRVQRGDPRIRPGRARRHAPVPRCGRRRARRREAGRDPVSPARRCTATGTWWPTRAASRRRRPAGDARVARGWFPPAGAEGMMTV